MSYGVLVVIFGVVGFLTVATLIGAVLEARAVTPQARDTTQNLNARLRSWWFMVCVISGAILIGKSALIVLFCALSYMALREFWTLTPSRRSDHLTLFLSFFVVLPIQYVLVWSEWYGVFSIFIPVYAFLILPAIATLAGDVDNFLARSARVQWALMLTVYTLSHVPGLLMLDTGVPWLQLLLYLLIVAQLSDVFQYVAGKLFGRHRLSPSISPSKTVEGLVGGGLAAVATGVALHGLTPFGPLAAAGMSAAIVVAGFFGGFVLSAVKRDLGAKDWGSAIEGHGGVLDRLDSITFSAPIFFHLTRYWYTP